MWRENGDSVCVNEVVIVRGWGILIFQYSGWVERELLANWNSVARPRVLLDLPGSRARVRFLIYVALRASAPERAYGRES